MLYRTIKTDTWRDPWFHGLNQHAKFLFMYLFTNPSVSACGAMELSPAQIAWDTSLPARKIEELLVAFGDKVLWMPELNLIVVRNFYRHQRSQSSDNYTKAAKKAMIDLPNDAKSWLGSAYPELLDTPPHPLPNPSPSLGDKEEAVATVVATVVAEGDPPLPPKGSEYSVEFESQFWQLYPKGRGSKSKSFKLWQKLTAEDKAAATAAIPIFQAGSDWQRGFYSGADVWLGGRMWENPPPPAANGRASPNGKWSGEGKLVAQMSEQELRELTEIEAKARAAMPPVWRDHDGPT